MGLMVVSMGGDLILDSDDERESAPSESTHICLASKQPLLNDSVQARGLGLLHVFCASCVLWSSHAPRSCICFYLFSRMLFVVVACLVEHVAMQTHTSGMRVRK